MQSSAHVVERDLRYVCSSLTEEFEKLAGRRLLVTGGAGFLGYYLIQAPLYWNREVEPSRRIDVTAYDNFGRGMPDWLERLRPELSLVQHDVTQLLPADMPAFDYIIHAASIASPTYYRKHPIATMDTNVRGVRALLDYARARNGTSPSRACCSSPPARSTAIPIPRTFPRPRPTGAASPALARAPATTKRSGTARRSA